MPIGEHNWTAPDADNMVIPVGARDQAPAAPSALERLVGSQPYWDSHSITPDAFQGGASAEIRWRAPVQRIVIAGPLPILLSCDRQVSRSTGGFDAVHLGLGQTVIPCPSHTTLRLLPTHFPPVNLPDHLTDWVVEDPGIWTWTHVVGHGGAYALVPDVGYHAAPADWDDATSCPST